MNWVDLIGYFGGVCVLFSLAAKTMIRLRVMAIVCNVIILIFGILHHTNPTIVLQTVLLPINAYRLREMLHLTRRVKQASESQDPSVSLSMDWLKPFMTPRATSPGEILFHRGDAADAMFMVMQGGFRLREIDHCVAPGEVVGELGMLTQGQTRTLTLESVGVGEVLVISYAHVKELYYQNPSFGFYFLRLATRRLFADLERAQASIASLTQEKKLGMQDAPAKT
jgi:CRP-like cAMP-binding protein